MPRIFDFSIQLIWIKINFLLFFSFLGSVISYIAQDKNIKRELDEYSKRLSLFVEKLQADLAERNIYNNHRTVRGKSKTRKHLFNQIFNLISQLQLSFDEGVRSICSYKCYLISNRKESGSFSFYS